MRLSRYFHELQDGYLAEIEDLRLDSEGRDVLERRLRDKRAGFAAIAPMLDTDPLMLAPALHGAFTVAPARAAAIDQLLRSEPDDFPSWGELSRGVEVAAWARPLVERALEEPAGATFLATVVGLEQLLARQRPEPAPPALGDDAGRGARDGAEDAGRDDEDDTEALGEDFLEQQGFDRRTEP